MAWFGWHWSEGVWHRVCEAVTMVEASAELDRLRPGEARNTRLGLTGGAVPSWRPDGYLRRLASKCRPAD